VVIILSLDAWPEEIESFLVLPLLAGAGASLEM